MELMERELRYNEATSFRLYHLCYYFSTGNEWDNDRKRLIQFKNTNEKAIRIFISQSINTLLSQRIEKELIIVRALSSKEIVAEIETEQPLDRLGKGLSATFGCLYLPGALKKKHPTKPIKSLTITNRQKELADVYQLNTSLNLNYKKILIIDDIVATGITACSIMKAILSVYPFATINVFSLAWTPTQNQQAYLKEKMNPRFLVHDPEIVYGRRKKILDEDFENGKTNISIF